MAIMNIRLKLYLFYGVVAGVFSTQNCGETNLTASDNPTVLVLPGYPGIQQGTMDCIWTIKANDSDLVVYVDVSRTSIGGDITDQCRTGGVTAYDGRGTYFAIREWCGTETPSFRSTERHMTLHFQLNYNISFEGFHLTYQQVRRPPDYTSRPDDPTYLLIAVLVPICSTIVFTVIRCLYMWTRRKRSNNLEIEDSNPQAPQEVSYTKRNCSDPENEMTQGTISPPPPYDEAIASEQEPPPPYSRDM